MIRVPDMYQCSTGLGLFTNCLVGLVALGGALINGGFQFDMHAFRKQLDSIWTSKLLNSFTSLG